MNLPFKLEDRYIPRQKLPTITWEDTGYDFASVCKRLSQYEVSYESMLAQLLYESAREGPGEGFIVELGTDYGIGACYLASGSKAADREKVITIDNDRGEEKSLYSTEFWERQPMKSARFVLNVMLMGVQDWIIPVGSSSKWASEHLDINIRLLFIDASHDYEHCASDILLWQDKIIPGGIVILHDYIEEPVKRAIDDYIVKSDKFADIIEVTGQTVITQKI